MPRCRGCATRSRGRKTKCSCRGFRANVRSLFCLGHLGLGKMRILPECSAVLDLVGDADKMQAMTHPSGNPKAKVFFALWPTAAERGQLAAWQKPLQHLCGGRDMHGETLHNTLVFIGDVEQSR